MEIKTFLLRPEGKEATKKEAQRIFDKFFSIIPSLPYEDEDTNNMKTAKELSLFHIDEIINVFLGKVDMDVCNKTNDNYLFTLEVKKNLLLF